MGWKQHQRLMINIINQIYEIQRKSKEQNLDTFDRNLERLFNEFEQMGYKIQIPLNNEYREDNMSIRASLLTPDAKIITKVIKPVIYKKNENQFHLIQVGIVIVE